MALWPRDDVAVRTELATLLFEMGRKNDEARAEAEKVLKVEPQNALARGTPRPDRRALTTYNEVMRAVSLMLVAVLSASPGCPRRPRRARRPLSPSAAQTLAKKLASIEKRGRTKPKGSGKAETVVVTEHELNSYLNLTLQKDLPKGVSDVHFAIQRERLEATGQLDLDPLDLKRGGSPFSPLALLSGKVPVLLRGRLQSLDGFGTLQIEEAQLATIPVPLSVLERIVTSSTRNAQNPRGLRHQRAVPLPVHAPARPPRAGPRPARVLSSASTSSLPSSSSRASVLPRATALVAQGDRDRRGPAPPLPAPLRGPPQLHAHRGPAPRACAPRVRGTIAVAGLRRARRMTLYEVRLEDESGRLKALWFNQPFLADVLTRGRRVILFGTVERDTHGGARLMMSSPQHELVRGRGAGRGGGAHGTRRPGLREGRRR